jgi:hypothetical protein
MQTIPNATWTKVSGAEMSVYQNSGANTWVDVDADQRIIFGPATEWQACMMSGPIDLSTMSVGEPIEIDWRSRA